MCTQLKEVVFSEGLQKIGEDAFYYCRSLKRITLPSAITEIGERAFYGCTRLRKVVFNEGLQRIGDWAFCDCSSLEIGNPICPMQSLKDVILEYMYRQSNQE